MEVAMTEGAKIWESIVPGESALVEYDSLTLPYKGFYYLLTWARKKGYDVMVIDILDTLSLYKTQISLAKLETEFFENLKVIKVGGRLNVGKVLARLPASDIPKLIKDFELTCTPYFSQNETKQTIVVVLGLSRVFLLAESKFEALMLLDLLVKYGNSQKKTIFYFVNRDVLDDGSRYVMSLLEELATTVIRAVRAKDEEGTKPYVYVMVLKAINTEMEGFKLKL
ncbi:MULTISPECIES: DUF257 family protein [Thermococcus]|uniref:DUF257 family protein n=1 Tax=Thermococcus TaxID=2263 RepID=UPI001CEDA9EB|nr:DUF257 family protein [Thermococcus bergensis]